MVKTTIYLPADLEARLNAESGALGVSKAELIREGIAMRLDRSVVPVHRRALPVFDSLQSLTAEQMDELAYRRMKEQAERR